MAKAKKPGGLYYTTHGTAVNANGEEVKGAPKRPKNTPTEQQPGSINSIVSAEDRNALSIANALLMASGKKPLTVQDMLKARGETMPVNETDDDADAGSEEGDDEDKNDGRMPTIAELPDYLQTLTTVRAVKTMQKKDDRATAEAIYEKRIEELQG